MDQLLIDHHNLQSAIQPVYLSVRTSSTKKGCQLYNPMNINVHVYWVLQQKVQREKSVNWGENDKRMIHQ